MKALNFSCIEILPSLLDKSKTQTIRPAWKEELDMTKQRIEPDTEEFNKLVIPLKLVEKPAKYKVGEEVKLYWNQRIKYKRFCKKCGAWMYDVGDCLICSNRFGFNKLLGTGIITEVFKIEMDKGDCFQETGIHCIECWTGNQCIDLAKRDGFKSVKEMVQILDNMYDLSKPKEFWIYRWKYIDYIMGVDWAKGKDKTFIGGKLVS